MGMPKVKLYYCCECGFGPHNLAIHDACIECGHELGNCCRIKYPKRDHPRSSGSRTPQFGSVPPHRGLERRHSAPFGLASARRGGTRQRRIASTRGSASKLGNAAANNDARRRLRGLSTQPDFGGDGIVLPQLFSMPAVGVAPVDGEEVWVCCQCMEGPMTVAIHPKCVHCQHERCSECKVENPKE